eukprot:PhF_6_TR14262/c0_g1_i3/m.22932
MTRMMMMNQSPRHHHMIPLVTTIKIRNRLTSMMNLMMVRTMTYKLKTKQLINWFRTIMNQSPQHHPTIPLVTMIKLRNQHNSNRTKLRKLHFLILYWVGSIVTRIPPLPLTFNHLNVKTTLIQLPRRTKSSLGRTPSTQQVYSQHHRYQPT